MGEIDSDGVLFLIASVGDLQCEHADNDDECEDKEKQPVRGLKGGYENSAR